MKRAELLKLLAYAPDSPDAAAMRRDADTLSRERFNGKALLLGQLGVERHACPGKCDFCAFSADIFQDTAEEIDIARLTERAVSFAGNGAVDALFLMTMHDFEEEKMLELVHSIRQEIPSQVRLVLNIGDAATEFWSRAKKAGISGAYHVLRLREGTDTGLNPAVRRKTIAAIRSAGLDWYYCCEPVGPEHSDEELADAIELGNEFGCFQHAAMARVNFPGSPMLGEIARTRLAQIVAAVTLASAENRELGSIAVHEPDALGLRSGANSVYAEAGANPRDVAPDTAAGRGSNAAMLRTMLQEANWR